MEATVISAEYDVCPVCGEIFSNPSCDMCGSTYCDPYDASEYWDDDYWDHDDFDEDYWYDESWWEAELKYRLTEAYSNELPKRPYTVALNAAGRPIGSDLPF